MKLKSLVISGFKSFPRRTVINFSLGVSAIVGPNGSGKSNIVDAIRWVLGEQNPRLLRADKMDELIFSGNSTNTMVDAARVKLCLIDCQDMAPPELKEFAEINIERVLFRDGTAKFLLNGKNCRLKEIKYLFLDTGTGARAYSIIDQGRVGQFVTMTPEERRLIVEEAAGIARYRERRIQALSRMKNALENIERLDDVIAEVKRQVKSLQRQAEKAEKFTALRKEEENLGLIILKIKYLELDKKEQELRTQFERETQRRIGLETEISGIDLEISRLDMELQRILEKQRRQRQDLDTLGVKKDKLYRELSSLEKEMALICQEMDVLKKAQSRLENKIYGLLENIEQCRPKLDRYCQDLLYLKEQAKGFDEEIERCLQQIAKIKKERERAKDQFVIVASKRAQIHERLTSGRDRKAHLEHRLEMMDERRQELFAQKERLKEEISQIEKALAKLVDEMEKAKKELQDKETSLSLARQALEESRKEKQRWNIRLSETEARLQTLIKIDEEGAGLLEATRILKKMVGNEGKIVADLIEVEDGYEEFVETALGQTIQSLVFDEKNEVIEIVEKVTRDRIHLKGASIILSQGLLDRRPAEPVGLNSTFEFLKDKVIDKGPIASKIRVLLFSWIIVDRISDILSADLSSLSIDNVHIISKDGFVFTPWKELRFIRGGRSKDAGLIARKKEIRRLKDKKALIVGSLHSASERETKCIESERDIKRQVDAISQRLKMLRERKKDIEKALYKARSGLNSVEDRLELVEFEREEAKRELDDLLPTLLRLEKVIENVVSQEGELKDLLSMLEAELLDNEGWLQQITAKKNKWLLRLQELKGHIKSKEAELRRMEAALGRSRREMAENDISLQGLMKRSKDTDEKLRDGKREFESLNIAIEDIERDLKAIEFEVDSLREKRLVLEKEKSDIQKLLSKLGSEINRTEINLSDIARNREHLADICLKQFQKAIDEVLTDKTLTVDEDIVFLEKRLALLAKEVEAFGPVNLMAMEEFRQLSQRLDYLLKQREDVKKSLDDIQDAIRKIDRECKEKFKTALEQINESLQKVFSILFEGGKAWLSLMDEKDILETGVEYRLRLPGKHINTLSLLSGGEKALAALALIFAIFFVKPTPFCLLDEVDAPLDESNTSKFNSLVQRVSASSQVILVTHNQKVMEMADCLYGVTMEEKGVSKLVTVRMV